MNGVTSADRLAAHRWTRHRVSEAVLGVEGAAEDRTPLDRRGVVLGPVIAAGVAAWVVWGPAVRAWAEALVSG